MIKIVDLILYPSLEYHVKNKFTLSENTYRYSSESFLKLFEEARQAYKKKLIKLNQIDEELILKTDIGLYGLYEGKKVPLDIPLLQEVNYQGKDVELNKPKRGGSKKFYVYVKNPKTGKVKKVQFGAKSGGQQLSVKLDDPKARKQFSDRHNCNQKKDKTTPGYWSCRLPRYWKQLGGSKNYPGYW